MRLREWIPIVIVSVFVAGLTVWLCNMDSAPVLTYDKPKKANITVVHIHRK